MRLVCQSLEWVGFSIGLGVTPFEDEAGKASVVNRHTVIGRVLALALLHSHLCSRFQSAVPCWDQIQTNALCVYIVSVCLHFDPPWYATVKRRK